jgi:hypothetical protein
MMALRLLVKIDPAWVGGLNAKFWNRWTPSLIAVEFFVQYKERQVDILRYALRVTPASFADALVTSTEDQIARTGRTLEADELRQLIDEHSGPRLAALLKKRRLAARTFSNLLTPLLEIGFPTALKIAIASLHPRVRKSPVGLERALAAARALLAHAPRESWPYLWRAIRKDAEFGTLVLTDSYIDEAAIGAAKQLSGQALCELYLWLAARPDSKPGFPDEDIIPSPLQRLEYSIAETLVQRGTMDAIAALEQISKALPERTWVRHLILDARTHGLEHTWVPATLSDVLALDGPVLNRLVRTDAQLAAVVLESLDRLQQRLHGPNPVNFALWDRIAALGAWKPKEEERLSDLIADHLRIDIGGRGLVINREVEIHSRQKESPGEVPDIIVSTSVLSTDGRDPSTVSVVIEVKGSYHQQVCKAMATQLVGRYMRTSESTAGVYCVGWYGAPHVPSAGLGRGRKPLSLDEFQAALAAQARELSTDGRAVSSYVLDASLR